MSREERKDLLVCIERILYFDWSCADDSMTTLTILLTKINSILTEIANPGASLSTFEGKKNVSLTAYCQMNNSRDTEHWIDSTRNIFEIYYPK